jgi:hypothetical protein
MLLLLLQWMWWVSSGIEREEEKVGEKEEIKFSVKMNRRRRESGREKKIQCFLFLFYQVQQAN